MIPTSVARCFLAMTHSAEEARDSHEHATCHRSRRMRHGKELHRTDQGIGPEERFARHAFVNGIAPREADSGVGVNGSFPVGLAASDEGLVRLLGVRIVRHFVPFFERATPDDDVLFGPLKATPGRHIIQVRKAAISDAAWYGCRTCDEYFRCVGTDACVVSL